MERRYTRPGRCKDKCSRKPIWSNDFLLTWLLNSFNPRRRNPESHWLSDGYTATGCTGARFSDLPTLHLFLSFFSNSDASSVRVSALTACQRHLLILSERLKSVVERRKHETTITTKVSTFNRILIEY